MKRRVLFIVVSILIASSIYGKVFIPKNGKYIELTAEIGNGSINDVAKYLGYSSDQVFTYNNFNSEYEDFYGVVLKIFTDEIVFVLTKDDVQTLSVERMKRYMSSFDIREAFDSYTIEYTLNDGIENKSLTSEYMAEVLELNDPGPNGTLYTSKFGYSMEFSKGKLVRFSSSDGLNKWAKDWKSQQPDVYRLYKNEAVKYWGDNQEKVTNEINIQADAFVNTSGAWRNEYARFHKNAEGVINFKMLLVAHYNSPITLQEFKEVNHGRYTLVDEFNTPEGYKRTTYKLNNTLYTFSEEGALVNSYTSE